MPGCSLPEGGRSWRGSATFTVTEPCGGTEGAQGWELGQFSGAGMGTGCLLGRANREEGMEPQEQHEGCQPQADPDQGAPADPMAHEAHRGPQPQERGLGASAGDTELSHCRVPSPMAPPRPPGAHLGSGSVGCLLGSSRPFPTGRSSASRAVSSSRLSSSFPCRAQGAVWVQDLALLFPSPATPVSPTYREPRAAVLLQGAGPPAPRPPPVEQVQGGAPQRRGAAPAPGEPGQVLRRGPAQAGAAGRAGQPRQLQLQDPCGDTQGRALSPAAALCHQRGLPVTSGSFSSSVGALCHH